MRGLKMLTSNEAKITEYVNGWAPSKCFPTNIQSIDERKKHLRHLLMPLNSLTVSKMLRKTPDAYLGSEEDVLKSWQENENKLSSSQTHLWPSEDLRKQVLTDPRLYVEPKETRILNPFKDPEGWIKFTPRQKEIAELKERKAKKKRDVVNIIKSKNKRLEEEILEKRALMLKLDTNEVRRTDPKLNQVAIVKLTKIQITKCSRCDDHVQLFSIYSHKCRGFVPQEDEAIDHREDEAMVPVDVFDMVGRENDLNVVKDSPVNQEPPADQEMVDLMMNGFDDPVDDLEEEEEIFPSQMNGWSDDPSLDPERVHNETSVVVDQEWRKDCVPEPLESILYERVNLFT